MRKNVSFCALCARGLNTERGKGIFRRFASFFLDLPTNRGEKERDKDVLDRLYGNIFRRRRRRGGATGVPGIIAMHMAH